MSIEVLMVSPRIRVRVRIGLRGNEYIATWHFG